MMGSTNGEDSPILVDIVMELIEVLIHQILHITQLYPASAFERRQKYNIAVWMCLHPDVNSYIRHSLETVRDMVRDRVIEELHVCLYKDQARVKLGEKLVLLITSLSHDERDVDDDDTEQYLFQVEKRLRSTLLLLNTAPLNKAPPSDHATFTIQAVVKGTAAATADQQPFPWVVVKDDGDIDERTIIPITDVSLLPTMKMQVYVETSNR